MITRVLSRGNKKGLRILSPLKSKQQILDYCKNSGIYYLSDNNYNLKCYINVVSPTDKRVLIFSHNNLNQSAILRFAGAGFGDPITDGINGNAYKLPVTPSFFINLGFNNLVASCDAGTKIYSNVTNFNVMSLDYGGENTNGNSLGNGYYYHCNRDLWYGTYNQGISNVSDCHASSGQHTGAFHRSGVNNANERYFLSTIVASGSTLYNFKFWVS